MTRNYPDPESRTKKCEKKEFLSESTIWKVNYRRIDIDYNVELRLTSAELAVAPDSSDGIFWMGPSVALARTLVHSAAPSPPGLGTVDLSTVPVPDPSFEKVDPELFSFIICPTTACLMSCSPMMRASIVLSAESVFEYGSLLLRHQIAHDVQCIAQHDVIHVSHDACHAERNGQRCMFSVTLHSLSVQNNVPSHIQISGET